MFIQSTLLVRILSEHFSDLDARAKGLQKTVFIIFYVKGHI